MKSTLVTGKGFVTANLESMALKAIVDGQLGRKLGGSEARRLGGSEAWFVRREWQRMRTSVQTTLGRAGIESRCGGDQV